MEAFRALATVPADQIFASGAVLAGRGVAFINLQRAVTSGVAFVAVASVTVADVLAGSVVAEESASYA